MVAHAFDPSTREAEAADLCEFEVSLVYRVSPRTGSKATQIKPCMGKKKEKENSDIPQAMAWFTA